ncbi:MAG TPA: YbfB/YjiJ family MFS transporter [Burkholderiales bacterium]
MKLSAWAVALCGLAALAVAMGIGRFAFTPILPMMQEDRGISVSEGGWLASANYLGYLLGALAAAHPKLRAHQAIRAGLALISIATLAMAFETHFLGWMLLRFVPGFGSAWVLVYVSVWGLERLAQAGRPGLGGAVFAGVGAGIAGAGVVCLVFSKAHAGSASAWLALGLSAALVSVLLWPVFGPVKPAPALAAPGKSPLRIPEFWRYVFVHGAFGLGYIIPATFLPVMAKAVMSDPAWFGWAWPAFGTAAMISTLGAAKLQELIGTRNVWALGNVVMATGSLLPLALPGLTGILLAAICVGGTFMVLTMIGMQEARRAAGDRARLLMAAMTSAFAAGQIAGPLLVAALAPRQGGFSLALATAALPLLAAAWLIYTKEER